jgi:O-antigen/teichoic acid export membrane protein
MVPGQLANIASSYAPVIILGGLYGPGIAGFYALAERVLFSPIAIIGGAIGDVYRQHASAAFIKDGNCRQLYLRTLAKLAIIGAPPAIALFLWGPRLFAFIFGGNWAPAGEIAKLLAVTLFCQMLSTPLSYTVLFAGFQRLDMAWQFLRLVVSATAILAGHALSSDYHVSIRLFAAGIAVMYLIHSCLQFRASGGPARQAR